IAIGLFAVACSGEDHYLEKASELRCEIGEYCPTHQQLEWCVFPSQIAGGECYAYDEDAAEECLKALRKFKREIRRAPRSDQLHMCGVFPPECDDVYVHQDEPYPCGGVQGRSLVDDD